MRITLVTGGARAGKSSWTEREAAESGGAVTYVATAEALDEEMARRIAAHRRTRPPSWTTVEEPHNLAAALDRAATPVVVVDCVTVWCANVLGDDGKAAERAVQAGVDALLAAAARRQGDLYLVTNEVGLGIVPRSDLARTYRDVLGRANAALAAAADRVVLLVAGLPLELKTGAPPRSR